MGNCLMCGEPYGMFGHCTETLTGSNLKVCKNCGGLLKKMDEAFNIADGSSFNKCISLIKDTAKTEEAKNIIAICNTKQRAFGEQKKRVTKDNIEKRQMKDPLYAARTELEKKKETPSSDNNIVKCPRCGSTQLSANKKGFSSGKAIAGVALAGGVGLLAGGIGSKKVFITCMECGKQWKAGK